LAQIEGGFSEVKKQNAVVLFPDIVDVTGFAEHQKKRS